MASDFNFDIFDATDNLVTTVTVSADDIADYRANDGMWSDWSDNDVAVDIYEQRYESALAKVGVTYKQAKTRGFHSRTR